MSNDATPALSPQRRIQRPPKCEVCADAIESGRARCTCAHDTGGTHTRFCPMVNFESTHSHNAMTRPEMRAAIDTITKQVARW